MKREAQQRLARVRPGPEHPLYLLRHNLRQVELARARGERLEIAWAWPTDFDAFLSFMDQWKVLDALERLPDRRQAPEVPLLPLLLCSLCRFLMGMESFREVEEVLFRHRELLLRLGFTVALVEAGAYPSVGKRPCDAECLSEVLRHVGWEALRDVLVGTVQRWRGAYPKLFRGGQFLVDSTHFQAAMRHEGREQERRVQDGEEKVCVLMLRTPYELIPVDFRVASAEAGGEGETTCGQALIEGAIATYGEGFIKELVWDRGYLDGAWLAEAEARWGLRWVMAVKDNMDIFQDAVSLAQDEASHWEAGKPPQFDDPRKQPQRWLCRIGELETWEAYGQPLTALVIKDIYPDQVTYQVVVTPEREWSAGQIHQRHRWRWALEECYNEITAAWQLGQKRLARRGDIYRALVALMLLLYALLQVYERTGAKRQTLQQYQRAFKLGPTHLIVWCGGWCAVLEVHEVNPLINMGRAP